MSEFLLGISLGFAAGISPGPLSALVVTTALQRGVAAGVRVAIAPLLSDLPVVALSVLAVGAFPTAVLPYVAIAGGLFIIFLGVDTYRKAGRASFEDRKPESRDLRRGFITNIVSPHPWLFWLGVGGPLLVSAWDRGAVPAGAFLLGFYGLLVGTKLFLAWGVAHGRGALTLPWYRRALSASGGLLVLLGGALIWQAAAGRFG
jgi:threonine/homoserine/homoserine lactone efflux protein